MLAQSYIAMNCVVLLACGVLLMHSGAAPIPRRALLLLTLGFSSMSLADIVWAMSKVGGSYLPGGVSDAMYLSCYVWLAAAAREHLRGEPPARRAAGRLQQRTHQGPALHRDDGLVRRAGVRREQLGRRVPST